MSPELVAILVTSAIEIMAVAALWVMTYRGQREMFRLSTNIARLVIQEGERTRQAVQA